LTFDKYPGYELKFIQKRNCKDGSAHLFSLIYKFRSPVTKLDYVLTADYHEEDVFAVKFYAKMHRKSEFKYSLIVNRGDLGNILMTCLKVIPLILQEYPNASFGFIGSRSYDRKSKTLENYQNTQRYNVYTYLVNKTIGHKTFQHYQYDELSGYLLVNRKNLWNIQVKERAIAKMFALTYNNLPDVV